ncbi:2-hydroxyacid dehydrogenase [Chroococcidiopsis thermalis]|uniref:D-isomer specific 2-hydroxyacid dehydrogenase NAD-binding protein n=1 Tax=Chroococcidiopsis thermalis (strain PCC 7203) TaxID=251229 RepID=K9U2D8_CHRTP|nr:D-glycerate dehydrogenase [Chroococcidiopsis thermalis]AFY88768.1 D-isomer specific 2-hydroxyacid dehydrogenase NAD-binding protein [Chroococcidiopsis thermalis PCC 7203]
MSKFKVFVTRRLPIALDRLDPIADVEVWSERQPPPDDVLLEKIGAIDGLLCLLTDQIDRHLIEAGTSLKVISQMAVGYDNIDIPTATARHLPVGHTPDVLTDATADFAWTLLMTAARRVVEADRFVRAGQWQTWEPDLLLGANIAGATLGIVGLGRIGQAVARRAKGFDMRILYADRQRLDIEQSLGAECVTFDRLLQESDFVTIHAPLTEDTYHLFSQPQFQCMKRSAILINTARGQIVDSEALYQALKERQIAAAALDVTDPEPIAPQSLLLTLDNLMITPHIASASRPTREKMASMAIANLVAGLRGDRLPHCVNPEVYQ